MTSGSLDANTASNLEAQVKTAQAELSHYQHAKGGLAGIVGTVAATAGRWWQGSPWTE